MPKTPIIENFERLPMKTFAEKAYLNYSMYVVLDRALPHLADGLKPVQRRIVYAMSELGLKATAKYKKSARTVGDVLGKFHPHGDAACYEAMVLMAQDFSYRYPLVDGQGNWGSIDDPKSFAAMRYTESRLSPYADVLLAELAQGTVDWTNNFDGTLEEPVLLPARLPNILLNGGTGIAVGMATDIPPHNLREVAAACEFILDHPDATLEQICEFVLAPDFPTGGEIITSREELREIYRQGTGGLRLRATYVEEEGDVVITALPQQTSSAKVIEQIALQMQTKKLPMVADLRDESDHANPVRIVITPRSNRVDVAALMSHLFATTELERSYRINLNMIGMNGRPQVKDLLSLLKEWLECRITVVKRRLQFRLDKVLARLHILDGLLIAYLNLDEVIAIIRREDEPRPVLMQRFKLTEIQAEAILELKLRHLAKLEEMQIRSEQKALNEESESLTQILGVKKKLIQLIKKELAEDAKKYGDTRRSVLVTRVAAQAMQEQEVLPTEAVTVILSEQGWIRAAKSHEMDPTTLSYKAGDHFKMLAKGRSNQLAIFLDSTGRSYSLPAHTLPSARGQGEPLTGRLNPVAGAQFIAVLMGEPEDYYVLANDAGYGFVVQLQELIAKNKAGKALMNLPKGASMLVPQAAGNLADSFCAVATNVGRLLIFPLTELPVLPRGKGNKMIHIPTDKFNQREEFVVAVAIVPKKSDVMVLAGKRKFNLSAADLSHYKSSRGKRGLFLPAGLRNLQELKVEG